MTLHTRMLRGISLLAGMLTLAFASANAQGVTTGALTGIVTTGQGQPVEAAQIQVTNVSTGFSVSVTTSSAGRYHVPGLESGPNYRVSARRIGFRPLVKNNVTITLGEARKLDFQLEQQAATLGEITVSAAQDEVIAPNRTGTEITVSDSALRRLPTLNRNFTDFVALTPQVSTTLFNGGLSGGGTNNRYNNVQIDGTSEADVFGLGSTGQPGGQANGKSIGLEAVKEYKVLLSPFDVRQGLFAGLSINAVTKSGTNEFHGSALMVSRTDNQTRPQPYIADYEQRQYAVSVGGPILKDRAFFFFSPEIQERSTPATGPYIGLAGVNMTQARADSFTTALALYPGLDASGGWGLVTNTNPLQNVYTRLDFNLPFNTQLVLRHNYGHAEDDNFFRANNAFRLSNNAYFFNSTKHAPAMQLRTLFKNGAYNELLAGYTQIRDRRTPVVRAPEITVVTPGFTLVSGSERFSHGNELDQDVLEITENFTMPFGSHRITFGTQNQFYKFRNLFAQSTFGVWEFSSIDSLRGTAPGLTGTPAARSYIVGVPLLNTGGTVAPGGDGAVRFKAGMYSVYAQDEWTVNPKLNLTVGLRADVPILDSPPENPSVLTNYGRSTAKVPSGNMQLSPRVGFNYDVTGDARNQLRGGVGLFTGRPAYVWLSNAFQNSGMGAVSVLTCSGTTPTAANRPPAFNAANIATPQLQCGGGTSAALGGEINLVAEDLKHPQNLRATMAYDRRMYRNWIATGEVLYTKGINGLFYQNLALAGPQGVNAKEGRTIYGTAPNSPVLKAIPGGPCPATAGCRTQIFEASNQSNDQAYSLTAGVSRRYINNFEGSLFYTYTNANDVQSFTSSTAFSQYRFGRVWGGDQSDKTATRSTFEQTHRFVGQLMYTLPTKTDVNVVWFGETGSPYTYIASSDLNGDNITQNDPVFVPNNALDPAQMTFTTATFGGVSYTPAQQAAAFESFIRSDECLSANRGRLLERNSCTNPFQNTVNVTFRQSFNTYKMQNVMLEIGVFNFLNLINRNWGWRQSAGTSPIQLVNSGNTYINGTILTGQPTYTFNPGFVRFLSNSLSSNYQIQTQLKYTF